MTVSWNCSRDKGLDLQNSQSEVPQKRLEIETIVTSRNCNDGPVNWEEMKIIENAISRYVNNASDTVIREQEAFPWFERYNYLGSCSPLEIQCSVGSG